MKRRWFRDLFRRRVIIALLILIQVLFLVYVISSGSQLSVRFSWLMTITSSLAVLYIVAKKDKGSFKTLWVFLILSFPLFGGLLYLLTNFQTSSKKMKQAVQTAKKKATPCLYFPGHSYHKAQEQIGHNFPLVRYLQTFADFPVYSNSSAKYLSPGEVMFDALLIELEKAEHYIFLEFFTIQEGIMWDSILDILKRKVSQGVKIRVIYDDVGCFLYLPADYPKQLQKYGIECVIFNPFRPFLTSKQNNRDHKKIVAIDGKVAFTGGINLSDEYINAMERFGHWKDSAVMINGKAAWSFTLMILEMWELCTGINEDYSFYYPWNDTPCNIPSDGFIQPYEDSPMDSENVGEHVYMQILNQAQNYVYITTPYLIIDDSMVSALTFTAKRGVDVRIITPHRWDKWLVHMTTRSYYRDLISAGVKIYEYSNGFIHSKTFVSDDRTATVGTTNLDYRSLYHHFECGALLIDTPAVMEIKDDFLNTLEISQMITVKDCTPSIPVRLFQDVLRLFAPLM